MGRIGKECFKSYQMIPKEEEAGQLFTAATTAKQELLNTTAKNIRFRK